MLKTLYKLFLLEQAYKIAEVFDYIPDLGDESSSTIMEEVSVKCTEEEITLIQELYPNWGANSINSQIRRLIGKEISPTINQKGDNPSLVCPLDREKAIRVAYLEGILEYSIWADHVLNGDTKCDEFVKEYLDLTGKKLEDTKYTLSNHTR